MLKNIFVSFTHANIDTKMSRNRPQCPPGICRLRVRRPFDATFKHGETPFVGDQSERQSDELGERLAIQAIQFGRLGALCLRANQFLSIENLCLGFV